MPDVAATPRLPSRPQELSPIPPSESNVQERIMLLYSSQPMRCVTWRASSPGLFTSYCTSKKLLFKSHLQTSFTSTLSLASCHSPTNHSSPLSCGYANDGKSLTSMGRSRALLMSQRSPDFTQTTA